MLITFFSTDSPLSKTYADTTTTSSPGGSPKPKVQQAPSAVAGLDLLPVSFRSQYENFA